MLDSRYLSYLLRHHPEKENLHLDKEGWCDVNELITNLKITRSELETVVYNNTRYLFNSDGTKIKAAHGHSINVVYTNAQIPPFKLYHGTTRDNLDSILKYGLKKMSRDAIHLSVDIETAKRVGMRHCKKKSDLIVFEISAKWMSNDGIKFYKSEDGVWLVTDTILPKYIKEV